MREVELDREEEQADLYAKDASIDVIAQEEVIEGSGLSRLRDHVQ